MRKNETANSSNEVVKEERKADTIAGAQIGRVTRLNVPQYVSPKSMAASSKLASKPASRLATMSMA